MDEDVQAALLQIIRMRQGFVCWSQSYKTTLTWIHHSHCNLLFSTVQLCGYSVTSHTLNQIRNVPNVSVLHVSNLSQRQKESWCLSFWINTMLWISHCQLNHTYWLLCVLLTCTVDWFEGSKLRLKVKEAADSQLYTVGVNCTFRDGDLLISFLYFENNLATKEEHCLPSTAP